MIDSYNKMSNLHEIMCEAVQETKNDEVVISVISVRVPQHLKERTQEICGRHGTNVSVWLRKCCENLCIEYIPTVDPNETH